MFNGLIDFPFLDQEFVFLCWDEFWSVESLWVFVMAPAVQTDVYRNGGAGKESSGWLRCACQKPEWFQLSDLSQAFSGQDEHDYIIMCAKCLFGASKWCIQEALFTAGNTEYTIEWPANACAGDKPHYPPQYLQCEWKFLPFHFQLRPMCWHASAETGKHVQHMQLCGWCFPMNKLGNLFGFLWLFDNVLWLTKPCSIYRLAPMSL